MENAQGLKTLGDYRRAARDSLFSIYLPPESKSTSAYDAIKTALYHYRNIIHFSRSSFSERDWWGGICSPGTKYEMINPTLFDCIKLMEFEKKYHEVQSIYDELYPDWPKRADAKISFFSFSGLSYLDAGFKSVRELGSDVIAILQNAYLDYHREIKICHIPSIIFLNNTPKVDDLEINPEPDIIIKTWFDNMLKGMKSGCPKSEYPRHRVKTEFNTIETQLEHEWNTWKKTSASGKWGDKSKPHVPVPILIPVISAGGEEVSTKTEKDREDSTQTKTAKREQITLQAFFDDYCDLSKKPDIASKREMLLREGRKKNGIKLPFVKSKEEFRRGQTYLYWLDELLKNWTTYRLTLTTLPPLKKSGNK